MVKYADIAKNRTKPFTDDFESAVKLSTKIAHADGKTTTELKWAKNEITTKVETKGPLALPVVDEVSLKQTVEFTPSKYTLTSEFDHAGFNLQAQFEEASKKFTLRKALGAVTAIATYDCKAWTVNGAWEGAVSDDVAVQAGAEIDCKFAPKVSAAANVKNVGDFSVATKDFKTFSSASLFPLAFLGDVAGYSLTAGLAANHSATDPLSLANVLVVAKGSANTIKAKVADVTGEKTLLVSYVTKAPVGITATWEYNKGSKFGCKVAL